MTNGVNIDTNQEDIFENHETFFIVIPQRRLKG